jgi:hypothetical protein
MHFFPIFYFIILISFIWTTGFAQTTQIVYPSTDADFVNPERGFYRYTFTYASDYEPLDAATLEGYRDLHPPIPWITEDFQVYSSLVFRYFFLDDFKNSPISQNFLDLVAQDFEAARTAGVKLIPRFAYTEEVDSTSCERWICPPYGDAPKEWVLAHIEQLAPVLAANQDVIAAIQMGFIGVWGENYYTDFFGDASLPPGKLLDPNWLDRNEVLQKMLDHFPEDRMIQVRYPQLKQRLLYGINAPTDSLPLAEEDAYSGSDAARLGFHNDCLLASHTDFGTYNDYGNSSTPSVEDTTQLKPYKAADSRYVVVGGETCSPYNPYDNCAGTHPDARADSELKRFHYSYLNAQFNYETVNVDWEGICMDNIKRELGYRFVLKNGTFPLSAAKGQSMSIALEIENEGYAAPYNPRVVILALRNLSSGDIWQAQLDADPRFWFDEVQLEQSICVPSDMPTGQYELLLRLADPEASLYDRAEYAIRFANTLPGGADVWNAATGYNSLGHTVSIFADQGGGSCQSGISFGQCPPLLIVSRIEQELYAAAQTIRSTATIASGEQVYFEAGLCIDLKPPFQAQQGSEFTAQISANCSTQGNFADLQADIQEEIEPEEANGIRIFPNPTRGELAVNGKADLSNIRIFDLLGRERTGECAINRQGETSILINLSSLETGWYVLKIGEKGFKVGRL